MPVTGEKFDVDRNGYRPNVGIIVCNNHNQVLWARRIRRDGWQFPQGGIEPQETAEQAAFRELYEEIGLTASDVSLLGATRKWRCYDAPYASSRFRGQKQRWFLFKLIGSESSIRLDLFDNPEFDHWRWVDYWHPVEQIIWFKKEVYQQALTELEPLLLPLSGREYTAPTTR